MDTLLNIAAQNKCSPLFVTANCRRSLAEARRRREESEGEEVTGTRVRSQDSGAVVFGGRLRVQKTEADSERD
jgi:hypothetical protein